MNPASYLLFFVPAPVLLTATLATIAVQFWTDPFNLAGQNRSNRP